MVAKSSSSTLPSRKKVAKKPAQNGPSLSPAIQKKPNKGKDRTTKPNTTITKPKAPVEISDAGSVDEEDNDDEEDYLHGFSSDQDSSDDDEDDVVPDGPSVFDVQKLPTIAKDDASVKRKLDKAKKNPAPDRGVIYLGRLPHGFFEDQLRGYFSQFGDITRLRVSRNKKTGASKHCAFIEFDSSSVAQIVAETMDNFLLVGHILRCKIIPKDGIHPRLWVGANRKWRKVPVERVVRVQQNKLRTEEEQEKVNKRLLKRQDERKRKLEAAGIQYDMDEVSYKKTKAISV